MNWSHKKCPMAILLITFGIFFFVESLSAVSKCGDQTDSCFCGSVNPYICCDNDGNGSVTDHCDGNCTWWAWEMACCNWGVPFPGWGNAGNWDDEDKAKLEYEVRTEPAVGTIGVRSSGNLGHVAWVTNLADDGSVTVSEMNCLPCTESDKFCCSNPNNHNTSVRQSQPYPAGWFSSFIYPPLIRAQGLFVSKEGADYGNDAVFFIQNKIYYYIVGSDILDKMKDLPRWRKIIDRPASVFKNTVENGFKEGPRFLKKGPESEGLLIRENGAQDVYQIRNGVFKKLTEEECNQINCWPNVIDLTEILFREYLDSVGPMPPQNLRIVD